MKPWYGMRQLFFKTN